RREPIEMLHAKPAQIREVIAKTTRLRRASARAWDRIPTGWCRLPGAAGARIDIDDAAAGERRERDLAAVGRLERDVRKLRAGQMSRGAVVLRHREVFGELGRVVQDAF